MALPMRPPVGLAHAGSLDRVGLSGETWASGARPAPSTHLGPEAPPPHTQKTGGSPPTPGPGPFSDTEPCTVVLGIHYAKSMTDFERQPGREPWKQLRGKKRLMAVVVAM